MPRATRSTKTEESAQTKSVPSKIPLVRKVFYLPEEILAPKSNELSLKNYYHPGKGRESFFLTNNTKSRLLELLEFNEPYRSWLIGNDISSNGRIYMGAPMDGTFLALHFVRQHCAARALALDSVHDEQHETADVLSLYDTPQRLNCVADVRSVDGIAYYKYNSQKTLAWLAIKTRRVAQALQDVRHDCGAIATSRNYSSGVKQDEQLEELNYLRAACEYVGGYIDQELYTELLSYLEIPAEKLTTKSETAKRKSTQSLSAADAKKVKVENGSSNGHEEEEEQSIAKPAAPKERVLTKKEQTLAKSAKGTKSISSFFKKS